MDKPKKNNMEEKNAMPAFIQNIQPDQLKTLDVRPALASGNDPLQLILKEIKLLQDDEILKIINTFEPVPLIGLLKKQGFEYYTSFSEGGVVETYFHKSNQAPVKVEENKKQKNDLSDWDQLTKAFEGKLEHVDVRGLEMPQPMMKILEALENILPGKALFVYHKRIPVFLLDELKDREFDYRIHEVSENEVHLIIFKKSRQ